MSNLVLVDTSIFIDYLRGAADDTLAILILNNRVLLSPIVRLELLAGVRKSESLILENLLNALRPIKTFASPEECLKLLHRAKGTGLLGGIPDLLILADAVKLKSALFTSDKKLVALAKKLDVRLIAN